MAERKEFVEISNLADKSELEKVIMAELNGPGAAEEEKQYFLGEFNERVIASLTKAQVRKPEINQEIVKAAKNPAAKAIVVHADLDFDDFHKYEELAEEHNLRFTIRDDPGFSGEIGLVVVSDKAVH